MYTKIWSETQQEQIWVWSLGNPISQGPALSSGSTRKNTCHTEHAKRKQVCYGLWEWWTSSSPIWLWKHNSSVNNRMVNRNGQTNMSRSGKSWGKCRPFYPSWCFMTTSKEDNSASKDGNSALLLHWGREMEAYMLLFLLSGLQFGKELGNCWCPLQSIYRQRCESKSVSCTACVRHKVGADSRDMWLIIQHNIDEGWPVGSFHSFIMSDVSWLWIDYCHKRAGLSSHRLWKWTCCTRYMKANSVLKSTKGGQRRQSSGQFNL